MLRKNPIKKSKRTAGRFAIVASLYNDEYVGAMVRAAQRELKRAGVDAVRVFRVPGAFEIPVVAAQLARAVSTRWDAVLCLGVVLRGATTHAQHIGEAVSHALMQIQLASGLPIIHEVLLLENRQQAIERCLNPRHNRGAEAAQTALAMARMMRTGFAVDSRRSTSRGKKSV